VPSIGVKYLGVYRKVPDNYEVVKGRIYESRGSLNQPIPEDIALGFIKDWRDELEVKHGVISNYIEVNGTQFIVQWKVTGSPEPGVVSTIVTIIVVALAAVAIGYALSQLAAVVHETGEVLSILGPENVSMIMNVLFMFAFLMMFGPLMSTIAELPKRLMPSKKE
jgi:hypothetical protein